MTGIQQEQSYPFTSAPSACVRLGRLWVDYAEANDMHIEQRVGETNRYVWLEQTPHQWYSSMLYTHWYIVSHETGWNSERSSGTPPRDGRCQARLPPADAPEPRGMA